MPEIFVAIFAAHLVGDFVLQTEGMVRHKQNAWVLLLHVFMVGAASFVFMGTWHVEVLVTIVSTHFIIDAIKACVPRDSIIVFAIDQAVHLAVLTWLALTYPGALESSWWNALIPSIPEFRDWYFASLALLSGLVLLVPAGGILIGLATQPLAGALRAEAKAQSTEAGGGRTDDLEGLPGGGKYIGWLERSIVLLLLLIREPSGIGFLIAAKSILRFGEIKDGKQRKVTEYIIIGTFLSFGWALLISVVTQAAVHHWLPPAASDRAATQIVTEHPALPARGALPRPKQAQPAIPRTPQK